MPKVRQFTVLPALPQSLQPLKKLAMNLYWSWNEEIQNLFERMDANLWEAVQHNPVKLLAEISQDRLGHLQQDESFVRQVHQADELLDSYMNHQSWFKKVCPQPAETKIAYFSAEFGIHESVPIYSGGLGILAGDHLKSASDLGIPLVGIGLMYQKGYFRQFINIDGWQRESYPENDFYMMPLELVRKESGRALTIRVEYPERAVTAQIWKAQVGRVDLYLLDTNLEENSPGDRLITSNLYGGNRELRIRQEVMLGIGGFKALIAMGIEPTVCHMNEGHAAFMGLERIRHLRNAYDMTFDEALEAARAGNVFTIHTPVKAGLDEFRVELMDKYFGTYFPNLGINRNQFLSLGRILPDDDSEAFKMAVLALKLSNFRNGVSKLHGRVSREMWASLWPGVPVNEIPIHSITNGVHRKSWVSRELADLYDRYLGPGWSEQPYDASTWKNVDQIPDEQFWHVHQRSKENLITYTRQSLKKQLENRGSFHSEINRAEEVLDSKVLTIGFARRFATYKRGNLLLQDPERLIRMLTDQNRPVQFLFAGKAHPQDAEGKKIIRQIIHFANSNSDLVRRRIVFLEDYDINLARYLVQGVDVWLNNPRRPMEASGTSGMKAAINGALNLSTLDGWWCEGYQPQGGWVIGSEVIHDDPQYQDSIDAQSLFNILENEVIPLYYTHSSDGLPRAWINRMRKTIKWVTPRFNTQRMVADYTRRFYNPSATKWRSLSANQGEPSKKLAQWKMRIRGQWHELGIEDVKLQVRNGHGDVELDPRKPQINVGSMLNVKTRVCMGQIKPEDIDVQIYHGTVDSWGNIVNGDCQTMKPAHNGDSLNNGHCEFVGSVPCTMSGRQGVTVRIVPKNDNMTDPYEPGLILWEPN